MLQTAFAIGNSVAVTIPKRLGIAPGTKFRFVPTKSKNISYEPVPEPGLKKAPRPKSKATRYKKYLEYYQNRSGGLKLDMSTEEFMKLKKHCHDNFYEEG